MCTVYSELDHRSISHYLLIIPTSQWRLCYSLCNYWLKEMITCCLAVLCVYLTLCNEQTHLNHKIWVVVEEALLKTGYLDSSIWSDQVDAILDLYNIQDVLWHTLVRNFRILFQKCKQIKLCGQFHKYTGKCLKPEQFLKAEHLLKHAFPYRDRSFYGPDCLRQLFYQ